MADDNNNEGGVSGAGVLGGVVGGAGAGAYWANREAGNAVKNVVNAKYGHFTGEKAADQLKAAQDAAGKVDANLKAAIEKSANLPPKVEEAKAAESAAAKPEAAAESDAVKALRSEKRLLKTAHDVQKEAATEFKAGKANVKNVKFVKTGDTVAMHFENAKGVGFKVEGLTEAQVPKGYTLGAAPKGSNALFSGKTPAANALSQAADAHVAKLSTNLADAETKLTEALNGGGKAVVEGAEKAAAEKEIELLKGQFPKNMKPGDAYKLASQKLAAHTEATAAAKTAEKAAGGTAAEGAEKVAGSLSKDAEKFLKGIQKDALKNVRGGLDKDAKILSTTLKSRWGAVAGAVVAGAAVGGLVLHALFGGKHSSDVEAGRTSDPAQSAVRS